ncbi:unnamed protein product [Phytophthora fragariaefolia]|uniref:Unnamed protein product n=1 Tax=Phytophthora fragariaefolia TaxID=1490495 RepID=A0A9W7D8G9_9STRA|nr:unnamed protein product [Phytophthora fragariaefolia]
MCCSAFISDGIVYFCDAGEGGAQHGGGEAGYGDVFASTRLLRTLPRTPPLELDLFFNLLKVTGDKYVVVGRDVALDEASVVCRSRQGRHMIVFNPTKPTGKYHFRLYMVCCSSTWIALSYKLYCNRNYIADRLKGVIDAAEVQALSQELEEVSKIRQHVLEMVQPMFGSNRVVNMDNYYASVQLLQGLRLKGLYGRGTIRMNSKHFPGHTMLDKDDKCVRGEMRQAVSREYGMVAASWCDGNIVHMVSNADASSVSAVTRTVGKVAQEFPAPTCVKEYNRNMQGVDRLDQMRERFSIADGHSFKRWHKKLALALIDIARSNAFLTRRLATPESTARDLHRMFMTELVGELIGGQWTHAPSEGSMFYARSTPDESNTTVPVVTPSRLHGVQVMPSPEKMCTAVTLRQIYDYKHRKRRRCIVCRWEGRYPTEVTNNCHTHSVCVCSVVYPETPVPWCCQNATWTCWQKFHNFYVPVGRFTANGNLRRKSKLVLLRSQMTTRSTTVSASTEHLHAAPREGSHQLV